MVTIVLIDINIFKKCQYIYNQYVLSIFWTPLSVRLYSNSSCLCLYLFPCHCLFVGQVISTHHFDQMSQRSKASQMNLWRCSLNVFVFVIAMSLSILKGFCTQVLFKCLFLCLWSGHDPSSFWSNVGCKPLVSLCCCVFKKVALSVKQSDWHGHLLSSSGKSLVLSLHSRGGYF